MRWMQELTGRDPARAAAATLRVCGDQTCVLLPNKGREEDIVSNLSAARAHVRQVVPVFSVKNNQKDTIGQLRRLCRECSQQVVLLVSGTGKPARQDTISVLRNLSKTSAQGSVDGASVHCAFNPYEPNTKREQDRLLMKLSTGMCRGLWLQLGSDVQLLQQGLEFLLQHAAELPIHGSVYLPSEALIAQCASRPWGGTYWTPEYLSSVEAAERITVQILRIYMSHGVIPLFESRIESQEQHQHALQLLEQAALVGTPAHALRHPCNESSDIVVEPSSTHAKQQSEEPTCPIVEEGPVSKRRGRRNRKGRVQHGPGTNALA